MNFASIPSEAVFQQLITRDEMGSGQDNASMGQMLDLCDEVERVRSGFERTTRDTTRQRLTHQKARIRNRMRQLLKASPPAPLLDALESLGKRRSLGSTEFLIVLQLLHRRINESDYTITGRDLLWILHDSSFGLFKSIKLLSPESRLCQAGLMTMVNDPDEEEDDYLNHLFMLSPDVFRQLCQMHGTGQTTDPIGSRPYADNTDYILDFEQVVGLYQKRAAKAFDEGMWRELMGEPYESVGSLTEDIERRRSAMRDRLESTPDAPHFDLNVFQRDFKLRPIEMIVVVTLLTQEALRGAPFVECIDVLRLVSSSTRDLLRKRHLFDANAPLIRHEIIELDDVYADKLVTGNAYLANWVSERLLDGNFQGEGNIRTEEKIEFHNYLSRLTGSDDFFDKLD